MSDDTDNARAQGLAGKSFLNSVLTAHHGHLSRRNFEKIRAEYWSVLKNDYRADSHGVAKR